MKFVKIMLALLLFSIALAGQGFEGFVKYKMESEGETMFMKYFKKGESVRMEPEMEGAMGGAVLFKDGKTYMLMPQQNMYMEFNMDDYEDMEEEGEDFKEPVKTGETKDILGYSSEKWIFEDEEHTTEVWAAKGLGEFIFMSTPMGEQDMPKWYKDLSSGGFFPMLIIARDKTGKVDGRMEVVEIKEQSISSSMFDIPANFQKFSMPGGF